MNKLFTTVVIVVLAVFAGWNWYQRTALEKQLSQLNLGQITNTQDAALAQEIVDKVKKHMVIDESVPPTVATIVDVETLRAKNDFYKNAKNGDHLIITPTRAILYDPKEDVIIDVAPVQLQAASSSSSSAKAKSTKSVSSSSAAQK